MSALVKVIGDVPVRARPADKYVNATDLCKAGGKEWAHYERNRESQDYRAELAAKLRIRSSDLVQKRRGGGGGTWVHPEIAIHLCMWISPEFAVQVTGWIRTLLTEGRVELAPPAPPAQPAGFVAVAPDPADPLAGQIVALQQSLALMLENRQRTVALEREQRQLALQVAESRADAADTRALAVCASNTARAALDHVENNHGYYTVRGFARLHGWEMPEPAAALHGRVCAALCRAQGVEPGRVKDERHGYVGSYPEAVLREHFAARLRASDAA